MRKSEMSKKQLAEREFVVSTLRKAGWNGELQDQRFEEDLWLTNEAEYTLDRGNVSFDLRYAAKDGRLVWSFVVGSQHIKLVIRCRSRLQDVVNWIVDVQDRISPDSYKDDIKQLVSICPETFVDRGEDEGLVQLTVKADI